MSTATCKAISAIVVLLFCSPSFASESAEQRLKQAQQCTAITERLERLNCFDRVMQTPNLHQRVQAKDDKPQAWHSAFESALASQPINVVQQGDDGDAWLTLSQPLDSDNLSPVLMMSCVNKISRIELALPSELADARIRVSVAYGPEQYWRSDDTGVLFSSARGLPAIAMMKAMSKQSRLVLRSNSPHIDGLQFNAVGLAQALQPLRQRCGW